MLSQSEQLQSHGLIKHDTDSKLNLVSSNNCYAFLFHALHICGHAVHNSNTYVSNSFQHKEMNKICFQMLMGNRKLHIYKADLMVSKRPIRNNIGRK